MKNVFHKLSLLALAMFIFTISHAQNPAVIAIESQLTDIEGEILPCAEMNISLHVLNSSGKLSYEVDKAIKTDDLGNLKLCIEDVPTLFVEGTSSDPAIIKISITSTGDDDWLEEKEFVVKYLITTDNKENPEYSLTRMEGQKLNYEYLSDIWKFQDIYPFAYIKSTFLISFNEEIADGKSLIMVANEFFGESEDMMGDGDTVKENEAPPSRGVKGGFAVGGLNQQKKKDK